MSVILHAERGGSRRAAELHRARRLADMTFSALWAADAEEEAFLDGLLHNTLVGMRAKYGPHFPAEVDAALSAVVAGSDRRAKHAVFFMAMRLEESLAGMLGSGPAFNRERLQYFGGVVVVREVERLLNGQFDGAGGIIRLVDTLRPLYLATVGME